MNIQQSGCGTLALIALAFGCLVLLAYGFIEIKSLFCSIPIVILIAIFSAFSWARNDNQRVAGQGFSGGILFAIITLICWGIAAMIKFDPHPVKGSTPVIFFIVGGIFAFLSVWYFIQGAIGLGGEL